MPGEGSSRRRRALSLVEVVLSLVLVSGLLVAALNTTGGVALARAHAADRSIGYLLGAALMNEILQTNYREPVGTPLFGLETNDLDLVNGTRANWDDVDDYHNLSETTLRHKGGKVIPDRAGWTRTVQVALVRRADVAQTAGSDEGLKRITITVACLGEEMARLTAVASNSVQEITGKATPTLSIDLELVGLEIE